MHALHALVITAATAFLCTFFHAVAASHRHRGTAMHHPTLVHSPVGHHLDHAVEVPNHVLPKINIELGLLPGGGIFNLDQIGFHLVEVGLHLLQLRLHFLHVLLVHVVPHRVMHGRS
ncbi:MAG: hypothetical protein DMG71_10620 [Acidobacteria bacterium]|nr:MAG: hypothetical protein DMG71_10620 [Acidobacteriota bacterium]